jgi:two-component system alkaline phosphatase synthesis response regulator PhoP
MADAKKVLVVDDEQDMVNMLKAALEGGGYRVITGSDGQEAVDQARKEKPDAVVLDLMMPGKDGFQACKKLKDDGDTAGIPVLVLTGIGQHLSHTQYAKNIGLQLESEDFITKPVDTGTLLDRLRDIMK